MKKTRPIVLIVGILVVILAVSGGVFAWFRAMSNTTQAKVTAGTISLDVNNPALATQDKVLPGEELDLNGFVINYTGNRNAIVKLDITGEGYLDGNPTTHKDWKAGMASDYDLRGGVYYFTRARLEKVLKINLSSPSIFEQGSDNMYYAYVEAGHANSQNIQNNFTAAITGELGGLYQGSDSRQFEQKAVFENVGLELDALQCTKEAVVDVWGNNSLNAIQGLTFYGTVSALNEWNAK